MNEMVLVKDVERRLQRPQDVKVFPLTPTHRKELRELRNQNIGELRQRLRTIKDLKKEEYIKKYHKEIGKELKKYQTIAKKLNTDWKKTISQIKFLIEQRKKYEETFKDSIPMLSRNSDYGSISNLDVLNKDWKREFTINMQELSKRIATQEFEAKFGESFQKSQDMIDKLYTMYEEAINFGDLEIVKEIYYKLKDADKFFEKVGDITI